MTPPVDLTRPRPPFPYDYLPSLPSFDLASTDLHEGEPMPDLHTATGGNVSPQLSWSGAPTGTRSYALTCFDPDAPTPAGFWHWVLIDLDPALTGLPQGAGTSDLMLDGAAMHLRNDAGTHAWYGPQPPAGDGPHRYVLALHALDVDSLDLDDDTPASAAAFQMAQHALARALLTTTYAVASPSGDGPYLRGDL